MGGIKAKVTNSSKFLNDLNAESLSQEDIMNLEQRKVSSISDKVTIREWEEYKITLEALTWSSFKSFLKGRADILQTVEEKV